MITLGNKAAFHMFIITMESSVRKRASISIEQEVIFMDFFRIVSLKLYRRISLDF